MDDPASRRLSRRELLQAAGAGVVFSALGTTRRPRSPDPAPSLAERLGYPPEARLLLLHADDLGVTHSTNAATIEAFEKGALRSGSAMVPSSWFPEIALYARTHPEFDLGLHLTFTSERPTYRWGPVLGPREVPSLVDGNGYFPTLWDPDRPVDLSELEAELRAQIDRARQLGIAPTHLDSHEHVLQWRGPTIFAVFYRIAAEYRLPIRVGRNWFIDHPHLGQALPPDWPVPDRVVSIPATTPIDGWTYWYTQTVKYLSAGVTELFVHPGFNDGELRAFTPARLSYGSSWRARDHDAIVSPEFKFAVEENGIRMITWREIGRLISG